MSEDRKVVKLEGHDLELAKSWYSLVNELSAENTALDAMYRAKKEQMAAVYSNEFKILWTQLAISFGLDPEKTWGQANYALDVNYIDHDVAFLVWVPATDNDPFNTPIDKSRIN